MEGSDRMGARCREVKGRKEGRDSMLCLGAYRVGLVASVGPELSGPEFVGNRITQFMGKTL